MNRSLVEDTAADVDALRGANEAFAAKYPGEPRGRQPVHTFYGGAQFYAATATRELGDRALRSMARHGGDARDFARALGLGGIDADLASTVHARVLEKLRREPIEDYRIDFEDGFGTHPDDEEDRVAVETARLLARSITEGTAPPFTGIRIKSLASETMTRAARTVELFIGALLDERRGVMPDGFVVTLPKVNLPEQPRVLVRWLERLESRHGLPRGMLRFEMMVETTQAFIGADGRSPLPAFLDACEGRCTGVHLGVYDFTASCGVSASHQSMAHPMCELARNAMRLAYGGRGVFLSDGSTHVLPVGPHAGGELTGAQNAENTAAVHRAWRLSYGHIRHSLEGGFYQGWDLHPAQLPVRFAACFLFFLEGFAPAAARLHAFVSRAATAQIADEPATAQALLNYVQRALACGAVDLEDAAATGLTPGELAMRSIAEILAARG
ncbi:MAG TPA: phosphoenolpyruvate kinase [Polyangiaceae bacterium]